MATRADAIALAMAVAAHVVGAVILLRGPTQARAGARPIEVEFRKPAAPPPPEAPAAARPEPPPRPARARAQPAAPRRLAMRTPTPARMPPSTSAPEPPRAAAPLPPVFGIAMDSPTDASSPVAVPVGGSTLGIAGKPGRHPGAGADAAPGYQPVSALQVKTLPDIDTDACGRTIVYPADAERSGVQGDVRLRVALDERGRVHSVRVLSGLGHGLDQAAIDALRTRCHFTPARDAAGNPVPFVVESYTFHFELPH